MTRDGPEHTVRLPDGGESAAASVLENVVDPVVAVADGTVTYANAAAVDMFGLPAEPAGVDASVLGTYWEHLERELVETAVGTVRTVGIEDEPYDARIHRGAESATITFDDDGGQPSSDSRVKDRAINEAPVGVAITDPSLEDNPLVYVNEAFERVTGYPNEAVVGQNCRFLQGPESDEAAITQMRDAVDAERPVTVEVENYRRDGSMFWNEVTLAPVRDDDGDVTHFVGFQNDVTDRKRAELEVVRRRRELEDVLERVEGLVEDVTAIVAGSRTRSDLERGVCERIGEEPTYASARIDERNPGTGALERRASAGTDPESASAGEADVLDALERDSHRVETNGGVMTGTFALTYDGIEYGALTVTAREGATIDDHETVVLAALARAVASGVNARETSRILEADTVVAVELDLTDETVTPLVVAERTGGTLEYHESVRRIDDETASLYTVYGVGWDDLEAAVAGLEGVSVRPVVERDEEILVELETDGEGLVEWLSKRGALTREVDARDGTARVRIDLPQSANVRRLVEALEERHPGTDVVSFTQHERAGDTRGEVAARLEASLTDRQLTALQRAHLGGYFEWPRPTTGEELAASMDISRPTFHEHLRSAEAKLCRALFDE
ncbi:bacterio-opsin activator domain-containing protein [Natronobiforma cellulositropha]|uniref:bacterio-opsin activator domain-containing protein n=1 Tax=Natronobiforma cellulositropha TaxID=1679076 RepID=UPI0021D60A00|nr:bacterio-opsin activator domain-containing protein [Natronobiforma cellulositropha]